jgi:two-component system, OmpR family, response regulator
MRLLVAEADSSLAEFLQSRFQQEHFTVQRLSDGNQLSAFPEHSTFDLVLLDQILNGAPGCNLLQCIQRRWPDAPVILLSGETAVEERVRGLNAGADDFVVKPFALPSLSHASTLCCRRNRPAPVLFVYEDLEINRVTHEVKRAGRLIELSPKEYALLEFLVCSSGTPVSRNSIIEQVWRMHGDSVTKVVDVYINYLRRKIDAGSDRPLIRTIRGLEATKSARPPPLRTSSQLSVNGSLRNPSCLYSGRFLKRAFFSTELLATKHRGCASQLSPARKR